MLMNSGSSKLITSLVILFNQPLRKSRLASRKVDGFTEDICLFMQAVGTLFFSLAHYQQLPSEEQLALSLVSLGSRVCKPMLALRIVPIVCLRVPVLAFWRSDS